MLSVRISWRLACAAAILSCVGCGRATQFGADNHRLLASLQTAVSARRSDWLEAAAKVIAERQMSGQLNDEQSAELESIVAKARGGDWPGAESDVVRLLKAQRSSAAERGESNSSPAASGK